MPQFMLLLYQSKERPAQPPSPEEMQKMLEKYMNWRNMPFTVDGHRLTDDPGRVVRSDAGKPRATDGPYSETKEILGGYYTINAESYDKAVELAKGHPHIEYGGTIEVRQVYGT